MSDTEIPSKKHVCKVRVTMGVIYLPDVFLSSSAYAILLSYHALLNVDVGS